MGIKIERWEESWTRSASLLSSVQCMSEQCSGGPFAGARNERLIKETTATSDDSAVENGGCVRALPLSSRQRGPSNQTCWYCGHNAVYFSTKMFSFLTPALRFLVPNTRMRLSGAIYPSVLTRLKIICSAH